MAQTATYYAYANGGATQSYRGKVQFNMEQDIENNQFIVSYYFWLYRADGYTGAAHNFTNGNKLVASIDGTTFINSSNYKTVVLTGTSESKPLLMCSGQRTVAANADGSKTFAFSFAYDQTQNVGQELDYLTVAGNHTCEAIPRATAPTLSASSAEFGKAVTITTNRASTSFTHTLRYAFGNTSGTIATGVTASQSWTVPLNLMNQIPNATSGNITIYCDTYNGTDLIGTKTVTLKATVPSSIVPTLSVAIAEAASIPSGITGYIQNKSKVKVTSTGAGVYSSTIKSYAVTVDGTNYNGATVTSNTLTNSGTITIKVVVTDSRGRTATVTKTITVIAYSAPKITSTSAFRCNSATDPTSNPQGEYICVQPRGGITALSNQNAKSCKVYYKKTGASSYSSVSVTMSDYVLDSEYVIFAAVGDSSYDIYTTLSDSFSASEFDTPDVQTTAIPIDLLMDETTEENVIGIAVGKQVEVEKAVDFGWEVFFRNRITAEANTYLKKGFSVATAYTGSSSAGYMCIAQFAIGGAYANSPIELVVTKRGQTAALTRLFIAFANTESTDPSLAYFRYSGGDIGAILVKSATSTWKLYVTAGGYDHVAVLDIKTDWGYMTNLTVSYPMTFTATKPSGTAPTFYNPASHANTATTATNATTATTANALKSGIDITVGDVTAADINAANINVSGGVETNGLELFGATPYFDFHFGNSAGDYTARIIENSSGALTAYNSISSASDERLKKDFAEIPEVYLDLVDTLSPELFRFKSGDTYLNVGLVAQKVLETEAALGITESVLVRGTGMEIPDPKNPDKVMVDYYSIDYQAYNILRNMALERKINRLLSKLGLEV